MRSRFTCMHIFGATATLTWALTTTDCRSRKMFSARKVTEGKTQTKQETIKSKAVAAICVFSDLVN